jgi:predicted enzyme related to lactoylglutathione lyase
MTNTDITRRTALGFAAGLTLASVNSVRAAGSSSGEAAHGTAEGQPMERVLGIGGFFFRAKDPKALALWYQDNFVVTLTPESYDGTPWRQEAGTTVFAPFKADTTYFGDMSRQWMINFRVKSLDRMVAQLTARGIKVEVNAETYPNGRFAKLNDPEGNPIELWEPGGVDKG